MNITYLIFATVLNTCIMTYVWGEVFQFFGIEMEYPLYKFAFLTVVIPALIMYLPFMERVYIAWHDGVPLKNDEYKPVIEKAFSIACRRANVFPQDYNLYIKYDNYINAYALGRNNIVVFSGAVDKMSVESLSGMLAHELSHIIHDDCYYTLAGYSLSWFLNHVKDALMLVGFFFGMSKNSSVICYLLEQIFYCASNCVNYIIVIPRKFAFIAFNVPDIEDRADHFACAIGLGAELYNAIAVMKRDAKPTVNEMELDCHRGYDERLKMIRRQINKAPDFA